MALVDVPLLRLLGLAELALLVQVDDGLVEVPSAAVFAEVVAPELGEHVHAPVVVEGEDPLQLDEVQSVHHDLQGPAVALMLGVVHLVVLHELGDVGVVQLIVQPGLAQEHYQVVALLVALVQALVDLAVVQEAAAVLRGLDLRQLAKE